MRRLTTGNEYISISDIAAETGAVMSVGFMHSGFRACVELHGSDDYPLLKPVVEVNGEEIPTRSLQRETISYWIPRFHIPTPELTITSTIFAPLDRRGFVYMLSLENTTDADLKVHAGWKGCWKSSCHAARLIRQMAGAKYGSISSWQEGIPVMEFRGHTPLFSMAVVPGEQMPAKVWNAEEPCNEQNSEHGFTQSESPIYYELLDDYTLARGEKKTLAVYIGFGQEEVSALASAQDLQLHGWERLLAGLISWLDKHTIDTDDRYLKNMMNMNSFYNYFYSQAVTLDKEELVIMAARSSESSSCAAYRDRDAMRWSLPAIIQINWAQARKMLIYAFTKQLPNVGLHSRFIDGTALEPGLQLDQLCSPIRALHTYVQLTGDMSILFDRRVQTGVNTIKDILVVQRHPDHTLFETLLLPSGKPSKYPYVCYSNVFTWRVLLDLAALYDRIRDIDRTDEAMSLSVKLKASILEHFIVEGAFGQMFARGVDIDGNYELGDDPEGSLLLLTYFGFCSPDDPVYKNTVEWIHSDHNPDSVSRNREAGVPVLSILNDLFTSEKKDALEFLRRAELDDGIACEYADPNTGRVVSGRAYASCAGYLAYGLRIAINGTLPEAASLRPQSRPSGTLYQLPPDTDQGSKKARL